MINWALLSIWAKLAIPGEMSFMTLRSFASFSDAVSVVTRSPRVIASATSNVALERLIRT